MTEPQLSISDIEAAERLLGIEYTPAERAQMVGNLEGQIVSAKLRRTVPLANTVPTASRFDPRLPGFGMPGQGPVRVGIPIADLTAGNMLAFGIMTALFDREKTGVGRWVTLSPHPAESWIVRARGPPRSGAPSMTRRSLSRTRGS